MNVFFYLIELCWRHLF